MCSGCFSSVKCKPTIDMRCVGEAADKFSDYSNVRICVVKYDNFDYSSNYRNIIEAVKNDKNDISHLVALYIHSNPNHRSFKFYKDDKNSFDAIIETDLDHLEHLLTAIMLDISLYHHFSLPDDLNFRKSFNNIKFNYILNKTTIDDLKPIFGDLINKESPIYLPFSMKRVLELNRRIRQEKRNETINLLTKDYALFLVETISKNIWIDEKGYISNLDEIKKEEYFSFVESYIKEQRVGKLLGNQNKILILTSDVLTKKSIPIVIEYNSSDTNIDSWLNLLNTEVEKYYIMFLKRTEK